MSVSRYYLSYGLCHALMVDGMIWMREVENGEGRWPLRAVLVMAWMLGVDEETNTLRTLALF